MNRPRYYLELEPTAGSWQTPPVERLRRALKVLLRGYVQQNEGAQVNRDSFQGETGKAHKADNGSSRPESKQGVACLRSLLSLRLRMVQVFRRE